MGEEIGSNGASPSAVAAPVVPWHSSWRRRLIRLVVLVVLVYLIGAYVLVPLLWTRYYHRHPSLDGLPGITKTGDGHPGDPLNVALIGTRDQVIAIMHAAGWDPADALSVRSSVEIALATVFGRPYVSAPVSNLYLFGRKEDLAFERPIGKDPRKRNHVRFWQTPRADAAGRPVWIGSATYDRRVGFSYTTGEITHHIGANVDEERDDLFRDLEQTNGLIEHYEIPDFHKVDRGYNGGGDPWHTDGALYVGVINPELHLSGSAVSGTQPK
jgi:hypothetical protein